MTRLLYIFVTSVIVISAAAAEEVDFADDIQPILNAKCVECHGGVKSAGGFSFVDEGRVVNFEADSGQRVVVPRNIDKSEMIRRVLSDDEGEVMPPPEAHPPLSQKEISLIKEWIQQGAKWQGHWSFVPPKRPDVPKSAFENLALNDIDRFIFHRMGQQKLKPSKVEDPGRLLRRLSFALIGLPPSIEQIDRFETAFTNDADSAIEHAVDELLSCEAFGERWATMWLDLVRYADSGGLGADQRRTIWPYRDWVINALNDDMPFDQFTVKQIAGDLLPNPTTMDLVATACHRNTQTNNEGGTDDEAFRVEAVVDRVNTTWQTWGGITFGCVQCHDHPYDPFRNTEYYRFMAFMNNTADSDLPDDAPLFKVPSDPARFAESQALRERTLELKRQIWSAGSQLRDRTKWTPVTALSVVAQNGTKYAVESVDSRGEFSTTGTVSTKTKTEIRIASTSFSDEPVTAIRLTVKPLDPEKAIHSPEWGFTITNLQAWTVAADGSKTEMKFRWSVPDVPWMPDNPRRRIEANGRNWGAESRIHYPRQIVLVPAQPLKIKSGQRLDIHISCDKVSGGSHPLVIKRGNVAITSDNRWNSFAAPQSDVHHWADQLTKEEEKLKIIPCISIPVMARRPDVIARQTHAFVGGNAMVKGDRVTAGLPATLTRVAPVGTHSPTRLAMARWWVTDQHPLTARVFVNRVWQQLFGRGIVHTLEDFGSSGDKPTHPELIDHLAIRFQRDHKWSVKAIVREIAISYVYRQSSRVTAEELSADPQNRFIARGPRQRLSAEFVRDSALAASGLLTMKLGGPPVHPPLPAGVWQPFDAGDKWNTAEPQDPNRYRRSIYTYTKRSIPFPTFATFDAPSREFCTPRRLTSNTPLQALVMLNDSAFVECAEALGRRMKTEFKGTVDQRIARGYRVTTSRQADAGGLRKLVELYQELESQEKEETNNSDRGWTIVAQVLLNLDDALTY